MRMLLLQCIIMLLPCIIMLILCATQAGLLREFNAFGCCKVEDLHVLFMQEVGEIKLLLVYPSGHSRVGHRKDTWDFGAEGDLGHCNGHCRETRELGTAQMFGGLSKRLCLKVAVTPVRPGAPPHQEA